MTTGAWTRLRLRREILTRWLTWEGFGSSGLAGVEDIAILLRLPAARVRAVVEDQDAVQARWSEWRGLEEMLRVRYDARFGDDSRRDSNVSKSPLDQWLDKASVENARAMLDRPTRQVSKQEAEACWRGHLERMQAFRTPGLQVVPRKGRTRKIKPGDHVTLLPSDSLWAFGARQARVVEILPVNLSVARRRDDMLLLEVPGWGLRLERPPEHVQFLGRKTGRVRGGGTNIPPRVSPSILDRNSPDRTGPQDQPAGGDDPEARVELAG